MTRLNRLTIEPGDPMTALESIDSGIALESFNFKTIGHRISDAIPNLTHAMKRIIASSSLGKTDALYYSFNEKIMEKAIGELQYLKVAKVSVFVPRGFQGKLLDYITLMESAHQFAGGTFARLTEYNQFLSLLISSPDTRAATDDYVTGIGTRDEDRAAIASIMRTFVTPNNHTDRADLGDTFARGADIVDSMRLLKRITDTTSKNNVKDLLRLVSDCTELLSALSDAARQNRLSNMSPETLKTLSSLTLALAQEVELVGAVYYSLSQLIVAMTSNEKLVIGMVRYDK